MTAMEVEPMSISKPLEVGFPAMRYDITMPILEGRVGVEGVVFKPVKTSSMVFADVPALREGTFDLWDLNLGYFLPAIEAGWQLIGLPVFSKRKPVYQLIFCHKDSGIDTPADLAGKRVGTRQYRTSVSMWARGLLRERYGVKTSEMHWVAQMKEVFPNYDLETQIQYVDMKKSMVDRFMDHEVDALITDISDVELFRMLENSPRVRRLFPTYMQEDESLYRDMGILTPMHIIVMSKKLDYEHPDLAHKLFAAFERAKEMALNDNLSDRGGLSIVYLRERLLEQLERWGDPWKYGIEQNRQTIDALIRYNHEQGMTRSRLGDSEIFARGTLDT